MAGGSQLFVRQSTGLVREASALDAAIFNAVFSAPVGATLAWGVFFALTAFPGSDLVTATIISFLINIPVLLMMSMLASSMPRTGGDYVWVSRILSPPLALVSNFGAALSATIGATFSNDPIGARKKYFALMTDKSVASTPGPEPANTTTTKVARKKGTKVCSARKPSSRNLTAVAATTAKTATA